MTVPKLTPARRRWVYDIVNALVGVAVIHGLLSGDEAAAWLLVVNAALGVARKHVPAEG